MLTTTPHQRAQQIASRFAVPNFSVRAEVREIRVAVETREGGNEELVIPSAGSLDVDGFLREVRARTGVDAVELCQIRLPELTGAVLDELAATLDEEELTVTTVPIDLGNLANPDEVRRKGYVAATRPWIDAAARLGAPFARVNAGPRSGAPDDSWTKLVEALGELADHAVDVGVSLLVENHGGRSSEPGWIFDLLAAVGHDRLGLILDTGNFEPMLSVAAARHQGHPLDEDAVNFEPVYAGIAALAPLATLVHAKAYDVPGDGTFGPVDLRRCLEIIKHSGFDGPVTVEYEGDSADPWSCTVAMVSLVREVFDDNAPPPLDSRAATAGAARAGVATGTVVNP